MNLLGSVATAYSMKSVEHKIGERTYELSNHLGNVLTVISDKPLPYANGTVGGAGVINTFWQADIRVAQDFSPFGVTLAGRNFVASGATDSRYGFQGQEEDDEVKPGNGSADGNSYDFGARMYDSRLGRFLSIDRFTTNFPSEAPYIFAGNTPIMWVVYQIIR